MAIKRKRSERKVKKAVEIPDSPPTNDDGTPLRSIFCLKRKTDLQRIEAVEDCFVLEFNPFDSIDVYQIPVTSDADLSVIAEKGKLACRDYPHSRHLCLKLPFNKTPHEKYCELCYCYVCDSAAPCKNWTMPKGTHCHALDTEAWKEQRRLMSKKVAALQTKEPM